MIPDAKDGSSVYTPRRKMTVASITPSYSTTLPPLPHLPSPFHLLPFLYPLPFLSSSYTPPPPSSPPPGFARLLGLHQIPARHMPSSRRIQMHLWAKGVLCLFFRKSNFALLSKISKIVVSMRRGGGSVGGVTLIFAVVDMSNLLIINHRICN